MNGHSEPGGKFHPHQDKPGIHSSAINHSTELNTGFAQRGSNKTLQHESRVSSVSKAHLDILLKQLESESHESPEQTWKRIEPIVKKLEENEFVKGNEGAELYLSELHNNLIEPNAEPDEYDDGAKFDNYNTDVQNMKDELKKPGVHKG